MDVKELLKIPQLYSIKKAGVLCPHLGVGHDTFWVKTSYLIKELGLIGCDDPSCDCVDRAFLEYAPDCEVVCVEMRELET